MRILIVTPLVPPESGGPSYYSVSLQEAFVQAGYTVDLLAFQSVRKYASGVRHLIFLYKVLWSARTVDALIILDTVSVALPAVLAGWLLGKKTIIRTGGDFVWEAYVERTGEKVKLSDFYTAPRSLSRKERVLVWLQKNIIFRLVSKLIFSTAWQKKIWLEPYGLREDKTGVIKNTRTITKHHLQPQKDVQKRTQFVWVGRELALKNVDALKKAFEKVKEEYPMMELVLLSNVSREVVLQAVRTARVLVAPSVSEVSPNIVYEALEVGTPVVCTADTGIREDKPAGVLFVDTLDEEAFTRALVRMCSDAYYVQMRVDILAERNETKRADRTYANVAEDFLALL